MKQSSKIRVLFKTLFQSKLRVLIKTIFEFIFNPAVLSLVKLYLNYLSQKTEISIQYLRDKIKENKFIYLFIPR